MGTLSDWWYSKVAENAEKESLDKAIAAEEVYTTYTSRGGSITIPSSSSSCTPVGGTAPYPYGTIITGGHSSTYYEAMAEHARREERNQRMIILADKLGLKSAEDVDKLMKEIGVE